MTGVRQSNWYVFGICQKKKPNAVYKAINMGIGILLVYESHSKVTFLQTTVYMVVHEKFGIHASYKKSRIKMYINLFFCCVSMTHFDFTHLAQVLGLGCYDNSCGGYFS